MYNSDAGLFTFRHGDSLFIDIGIEHKRFHVTKGVFGGVHFIIRSKDGLTDAVSLGALDREERMLFMALDHAWNGNSNIWEEEMIYNALWLLS